MQDLNQISTATREVDVTYELCKAEMTMNNQNSETGRRRRYMACMQVRMHDRSFLPIGELD